MREENKTICSYVLPSVASLLVIFMYITVDSIFVGRGVGADALAAVNLALPFAAIVTSLADLIAMGGATIAAVRLGRNDAKGASQAASTSVFVTLVMSCIICGIGMVGAETIARASGASGRLIPPTVEYLYYYSAFAIFAVLGICLSAFVRNDGRPGLAFYGMVAGAAANIFLDWLFIFPWGMGIKGAAIASGIGQILTVAILLSHFVSGKNRLRIRVSQIAPGLTSKICLRGIPEFITQISQPVTVLFFNIMIFRQLGETGIAAYAIICNLTSLIFAVLTGVAGGMQPLFGRSYGEKNRTLLRYYSNAGIVVNLVSAAVLYVCLAGAGMLVVGLFSTDTELTTLAAQGLSLYGLSFVVASVNITVTALFLSTKRTGKAMLVAGLRGCVLNVLAILVLPAMLGSSGLWMVLLFAEIATMLVSVALLRQAKRQRHPDSVIIIPRSAA